MLRMTQVRPARERQQSSIAARLRAVAWLVGLALSGCAITPPAESPAPSRRRTQIRRARYATRRIAKWCGCGKELAGREAELRELRINQREQVKVIQESTREVTRAKVKLRRLATQAETASYIAEVEAALESLRASFGAAATSPLLELARAMITSTAAPFAQADYGTAMDRAAAGGTTDRRGGRQSGSISPAPVRRSAAPGVDTFARDRRRTAAAATAAHRPGGQRPEERHSSGRARIQGHLAARRD
jgi:hypothetical protein